ncbi:hypothetical protein MKY37_00345 [Psychrobacillus sp. FSL K6-2836]|uniref:hypothetical protein n=1 Tax=Psychrobacillus sp. FSL K6-2836 TaxID=2921548 RepID=UPI0030FAFF38
MKKFYATLVLLLCSLLVLALSVPAQEIKSPKVLTYHGESENWVGDFTLEISKGAITRLGKIKYQGEDVVSVGWVSCTFETGIGTSISKSLLAGVHPLNSPKGEKGTLTSYSVAGSSNERISTYSKVKIVKVTVEWDEKTESFNLYKQ